MRGRRWVGSTLATSVVWLGSYVCAQPPMPPAPPGPPTPPANSSIQPTSGEKKDEVFSGQVLSSVMARVNGQPILAEEVLNAATYRLEEARSRVPPQQFAQAQAEIIRAELDEIINRELLLQDAAGKVRPQSFAKVKEAAGKEFDGQLKKQKAALKMKNDEELIAYLEKQGRSVDEMRRQFERSFMAMEYVRNLVRAKIDEVSREQLLEYYKANPKEFEKPERVTWQHVFIDSDRVPSGTTPEQYAQMVWGKVRSIKNKEEFAAIATEFSHGPSRFRNGEGEGNERGMIRPTELEELVFSLRSGETGPVVPVSNGFHVVRMVDHAQGGKQSFEAAVPEIRRKLQNKIGQAEYNRIVKELRSKAYVENAQGK